MCGSFTIQTAMKRARCRQLLHLPGCTILNASRTIGRRGHWRAVVSPHHPCRSASFTTAVIGNGAAGNQRQK